MKKFAIILMTLVLSLGMVGNAVAETCTTIDFDDFKPGTIVSDQYPFVTISAMNAKAGHPDEAIIFDSAAPTGEDEDLGTPNEDFGGPGIGTGGEAGEPGENKVPLGHVLIIAEDIVDANNDTLVDDPDDEAKGGMIFFDFDFPVELVSVIALDIDDSETPAVVDTINPNGSIISTTVIAPLGDNSFQVLEIEDMGVATMKVSFPKSGAVTDITYCIPDEDVPEFTTIGALAALGLAGVVIYRKRQ